MLSLKEIQAPVAEHIRLFEDRFRASMKTNVPLLDKIMHYIVKRKGKQMRPLFVFLAASVTGGIKESTYRAATLIELLHTATWCMMMLWMIRIFAEAIFPSMHYGRIRYPC
jgi:octaprenyl-diphosphate synthase